MFENDPDEFSRRVELRVNGDNWVVDGNYSSTRDLVLPRATEIVWLNLPVRVFFPRVVWRSIKRAFKREELWNGNREPIWGMLRAEHPIRWSLSTRHKHREKYPVLLEWVRAEGKSAVELRSDSEIRDWFESL